MPITIMLPLMKQIKLFLSLIVKTLDGKLILVKCKSIIQNMVHIATRNMKVLSTWLKFLEIQRFHLRMLNSFKLKLRLKSKQKLKFSVRNQIISIKFLRKFKNGAKTTKMLKTSQTRNFQKITISETWKATISLVKSEIKVHAAPAIPSPSPKSLNPD